MAHIYLDCVRIFCIGAVNETHVFSHYSTRASTAVSAGCRSAYSGWMRSESQVDSRSLNGARTVHGHQNLK